MSRIFLQALSFICLAGVLTGCTSGSSLLEKSGPLPVAPQSLIHPPWEALVKAGPDAEKDIDLETLNGSQAATAIPAETAPSAVSEKPAAVSKPGGTAIKAVAVLAVSGASLEGDKALTMAMRQVLAKAGWPVISTTRKDALTIEGKVSLEASSGASQMVHINWLVRSPSGKDLGDVAQHNPVAAHSLDGSWGPAATYAAEAAADGIFKLIGQYR